jgi:sulfate permease, SulP family
MLGFINGLALVVARSQLESFQTEAGNWLLQHELIVMSVFTATTMAIIYVWEQVGRVLPAPLVAVLITTAIVWFTGADTCTVGDLADIKGALPTLHVSRTLQHGDCQDDSPVFTVGGCSRLDPDAVDTAAYGRPD